MRELLLDRLLEAAILNAPAPASSSSDGGNGVDSDGESWNKNGVEGGGGGGENRGNHDAGHHGGQLGTAGERASVPLHRYTVCSYL